MKKNYHLYLGKADHLTVMSEFLTRGWNVAIPEVDIGDDIFVVQDDNGTLRRVQVKTSTSTIRQSSYSGQFNVPLTQLRNIANIPVHYVFVVRHNEQWTKPVVIRQDYLLDHLLNDKMGTEHDGYLNLYFSYSTDKVECSGLDLTKYIGQSKKKAYTLFESNLINEFEVGTTKGLQQRIWLDMMLKKQLKKCVDWSKIGKENYMNAMIISTVDSSVLKQQIETALTTKINNREMFRKGIDYSYYYEE